MNKVRTRMIATLAVVALVAAACGGDDDAVSPPAATDPPTTTEADSDSGETTVPSETTEPATEPDEPDDGPLRIMAFGTYESQTLNLDQSRAAVLAHVELLNRDGGINGRLIEVVICNDNFDPNEAASCARRAADEEIVAVVGPASGYASAALPILEEAQIPFLNGTGAGGVIELTSPVSFPLHGGSQVQLMGAGRAVVDEGAERVAIIVADADQAREAGENIARAIDLGGASSTTVTAPLGAPDYSAVAAAALDSDPQGVVIAHVPADAPKIVQSLRQAGYDGLIATSTGILPQVGVDAIGEAAEGVLLLDRGELPTDDSIPEVAAYLAGMAELEPDARIDAASLNSWAAVTFFAELVRRTDGPITGARLIETLRALDAPIETGAFPPYTGPSDDPPVPEFPQVVSFQAKLAVVENGLIVSGGGFIDPLAS